MSDVVRNDIEKLVEKELKAANEKFPLFQSNHEGYAVIKEEVEEANENFNNVTTALEEVWIQIKYDNKTDYDIEALRDEAIHGAVELIQVAAMAQKFIDSEKARGEINKSIDEVIPFHEVEE